MDLFTPQWPKNQHSIPLPATNFGPKQRNSETAKQRNTKQQIYKYHQMARAAEEKSHKKTKQAAAFEKTKLQYRYP
jgi:hypothetical protein